MDRFYSASATITAGEEPTMVHTATANKYTIIFGGSICNKTENKIAKVTVQLGPDMKYILKDTPVVMDSTLMLNKMTLEAGQYLLVSCTNADVDVVLSYIEQDILEDE